MPTTLYTPNKSGTIGFKGKEYTIKNGEIEVPDDAVETLVETHGFSKTALEKPEKAEAETEAEAETKKPTAKKPVKE